MPCSILTYWHSRDRTDFHDVSVEVDWFELLHGRVQLEEHMLVVFESFGLILQIVDCLTGAGVTESV
jgi:hypothetical protein